MASELEEYSKIFTELLKLKRKPIAVSILSEIPTDVKRAEKSLPPCAFWSEVNESIFYAVAEDHYPCAIGAEVMGFKLTADAEKSKKDDFDLLASIGYKSFEALRMEFDLEGMPRLKNSRAILYAPLSMMQHMPDTALFIVKPLQAMLLAEALGWNVDEDGNYISTPGLSNIPGCAVIAFAHDTGKAAFTLACSGSRPFAAIKPEEILFAISGKKLKTAIDKLSVRLKAQKRLEEEYSKAYPSIYRRGLNLP